MKRLTPTTQLVLGLVTSLCLGLMGCSAEESNEREKKNQVNENKQESPNNNSDSTNEEIGGTITDIVASNESFTTLLAAVSAAELAETLGGEGPYTVFAPTDEAFAKLGDAAIEDLLKPENKGKLTNILLHHVVPGTYKAADVLGSSTFDSAFGQSLAIDTNGPSVGGSAISATDIIADNGVIHVIDQVIIPSNIGQVADAAGFTTLLAALQAADLTATISDGGPFTVFAPTDAAFAALPAGTLEDLLLPENKDQLTAILTYHVVAGDYKAADVLSSGGLETLQGSSLAFSNDDAAKINNTTTITTVDIPALNGTIHVIDTVLLP
ncbi:MAG: beta-Ig-H3/fasciclin [Zetaproteobacteria bacterium]|nr:beta-Ig-H3/fasciclin [Pseudobdellovibrionaceae bacterium]